MFNEVTETMEKLAVSLERQGYCDISTANNDDMLAIKYFSKNKMYYVMAYKNIDIFSHSIYGVNDNYIERTFYNHEDFVSYLHRENMLNKNSYNLKGLENLMRTIHNTTQESLT